MGNDADAVVDPKLKFKGIDGLRIADASVMPTVTSGNTNAPTIMIAERAADFIARGLRATQERVNFYRLPRESGDPGLRTYNLLGIPASRTAVRESDEGFKRLIFGPEVSQVLRADDLQRE